MSKPALDDTTKTQLADTAKRYAEQRAMPLAIARTIVWQAYKSKGLTMALSLAGAVQERRPLKESASARSALENIRRKLRGGRVQSKIDLENEATS